MIHAWGFMILAARFRIHAAFRMMHALNAEFMLRALRIMIHAWCFMIHAARLRIHAVCRIIHASECRIHDSLFEHDSDFVLR